MSKEPEDVKKYEVVICKGLPASGKSTWAKKQALKPHVKRVNKDGLRDLLDNNKYTSTNEEFVLKIRDEIISNAIISDKSIIVDDTNFHESHEHDIRNIIKSHNDSIKESRKSKLFSVRVEFFDVAVMECIRRNAQRNGHAKVPHTAIFQMYNTYVKSKDDPILSVKDIPEGLIFDRDINMLREQDESLGKAIICDLDGTLSIMVGRSPHSTEGCIRDRLNKPISDLLKNYHALGHKIILFSGRRGEQRIETEKWLNLYDIPYDIFAMRAIGDMRSDRIIKKEFFDTHVEGEYNIDFVLDDRDQVVDLWRKDMGLTCLQVNYGNF